MTSTRRTTCTAGHAVRLDADGSSTYAQHLHDDRDPDGRPCRMPARQPLLHLTYTGPTAGSYLCGAYATLVGHGTRGERHPDDRGVHFAYAADELLQRGHVTPDGRLTCPACLDVVEPCAACDAEAGDDCAPGCLGVAALADEIAGSTR